MGEKDYQQLYLVKKYTKKKFRSKIIACKTIRDKNKLALSSRNSLLNKIQLIKAGEIARDIILFKKKIIQCKDIKKKISFKKRQLSEAFNINIEYFELRNIKNLKNSNKTKNSRIFIAYYLNKIRLIDNF